jgi:CO/xanthine dehydrogenase Mo-binding subunit
VIAGGACKLAARTLRERLNEVAAQILETAAADIEITDCKARVRGTDIAMGVPQLARAAYHESHRFPEGGAIGAPAAVLNVVSDALSPFGIEIFEMPITPQRIVHLLSQPRDPSQ